MPPTTTRRPRRSQSQWQTLIEAQQASGQSATDYCETHDIGYVSFCKWRKRLSQPVACGVTDQQHGSNFIVSALKPTYRPLLTWV